MPNKFTSLLPPNALPSERAMEEASAIQIEAIPNPIRAVKNADDCPVELLPWLAWEYSVDTWNTDWTEQEKRSAIKRAEYIHRHRGTPAAVEMSLSDSPFSTEIVEWFNQTPPGKPYTFQLNVEQDGRPIAQTDIQDLKNAVLRAKNLRSWFGVTFHGKAEGNAILAGYMLASEKVIMTVPFLLARIEVNDWTYEDFKPVTGFAGASYRLILSGAYGRTTWQVSGPGTVSDDGVVTLTGPGTVSVTAINSDGQMLTHTVSPSLWFYTDGSKGTISELEDWAASHNGRVPDAETLSLGLSENDEGVLRYRGQPGSLHSEWGDLAAWGWAGAPDEGSNFVNYYATLTPGDTEGYVCFVVLAGNRPTDPPSGNGTMTEVSTENENSFLRCCVINQGEV